MGVVGICLFVWKAQKRTEYVGPVDPKSGYRCRFTLAPGWSKDDKTNGGYLPEGEVVEAYFRPSQPNPIAAWITVHLLHRQLPSRDEQTLTVARLPDIAGTFPLRNGYPINGPDRMQSHLKIDGFPSTVYTQIDQYISVTALVVYVPQARAGYIVGAMGRPHNVDHLDSEMQAIIASFHIEKVAGDKQGIRP
jgi:hypothetical protein